MNTLRIRRPMPHGRNDIGWRTSIPGENEHWFMSTGAAHVVISHCGQVYPKTLLSVVKDATQCLTCKIIEDMRDKLDGKNE